MGNALCLGYVISALSSVSYSRPTTSLCCRKNVSSADRAILELKVVRRNLIKRSNALEEKATAERGIYAKLTHSSTEGNNTRAKLVLRHIRALEKAITQCHAYSFHVDSILLDMSEQNTLIEVVQALKDGKQAMLKLGALLDVQDVEALLEDGARGREKQKALENCLSQSLHDDFDVATNADLILNTEDQDTIPPSVPVTCPAKRRQSTPLELGQISFV